MTVAEMERLNGVVGKVLGIDREIVPQARVDTIPSWDSLAHLSLLMAIEEEFNVSFDADEIAELGSVSRIAGAIDRARVTEVR